MSRIISIVLQKGGVGKTTCAVNLAGALVGHLGLRTLLLDLDPQVNATTTLLGRDFEVEGDAWNVLHDGESVDELMVQSSHDPRLFVLPGSRNLAYLEKQLADHAWDRLVLEGRRIIRESVPEGIDVVLIDTPPSLGLWLHTAIAASDGLILVAQPHEYAADGIRDLMKTVHAVQGMANPDLQVDGLIINLVRAGIGEHMSWVEQYRAQFGDALLEPPILERIAIAEAQRMKTPLEFYDARGAVEPREWFRQMAEQLVQRTGITPGTGLPESVDEGEEGESTLNEADGEAWTGDLPKAAVAGGQE